ncbi:MAG: hypothetical protein A2487_02505 [Candidatus Raymondbacteria bacterium RifOxyC12_full_50_8]|uniref:Response regulatory domain-containing protein n=1 Tax=Candidatus Raymondbacteria bacterium RIFOXYD12_FULL_49_13 TaxID=1817890 RepID=A0A1F7FIG6_UNCRA|nr:MAG: hypothetical protein A2248_21045 [Candidatus Raymondbacteria bacterium RIFOXYA2_FULL_49_16]OGJ95717.1 MAG: hypothetical protein A2350_12325 [Candidatus Raymondbacteria bacterium RifOxyB12_full_50_8]OGK06277.1 MAG: hypothetical protein A2519_08360 [Candidatus Raymondbacteria bacterium RIFOXYD12_FULL_49_13]OGK07732.1 MAG: hypothetical protein A2487_02505 [Candidatus Raymondbacteria bacterium RifOxyC12_full_50_8]OGP40609.1 MAG: hypothetical protein A2324_03115 [Candidatus Raymondbacteria b
MGVFINNKPDITAGMYGVLIMDDDAPVASLFAENITRNIQNAVVVICSGSRECLALCRLFFFHVILCDIRLPKDPIDGDQVIQQVKEDVSKVPFIISMTADRRETVVRANNCNADDFFDKCDEDKKTDLALLTEKVKKGFTVANAKLNQLQEKYGIPQMTFAAIQAAQRKKRGLFSKNAGYPPTTVAKTFMFYKALADKWANPRTDLETIALNAGFGSEKSFMRLRNKLKAIINLPAFFIG